MVQTKATLRHCMTFLLPVLVVFLDGLCSDFPLDAVGGI